MMKEEEELKRRFKEDWKMIIVFYRKGKEPIFKSQDDKTEVAGELVPFYPTHGTEYLEWIKNRVGVLKDYV